MLNDFLFIVDVVVLDGSLNPLLWYRSEAVSRGENTTEVQVAQKQTLNLVLIIEYCHASRITFSLSSVHQ